jgi:hypothetical protein
MPLRLQTQMKIAHSFLGTAHSFLGTDRSFLGTARSFLRTARSFLGTDRSFLGTARSFLGTARSFLGTVRSFLGTGRPFLGTVSSHRWALKGGVEWTATLGRDSPESFSRGIATTIRLPAPCLCAGAKMAKTGSPLQRHATGIFLVCVSFSYHLEKILDRMLVELIEVSHLISNHGTLGWFSMRKVTSVRPYRFRYQKTPTFRDCLLDMVDKAKGVKARKRRTSEYVGRDYGKSDAERWIETCGPHLGLPTDSEALAKLPKGDERKALLATVLRSRTMVGFDWIAKRLSMGHPSSVSRQVDNVKRDRKLKKRTVELEKMLQC